MYQFCPWSQIHCVQLIVYLGHISIVLIPFNIDDDGQITLQYLKWLSREISLHCVITSPVVTEKLQHCEISNALAMNMPQFFTRSCNEKGFLIVRDLWNLCCGGTGGNKKKKKLWYPSSLALEIPQPCIMLFNATKILYRFTPQMRFSCYIGLFTWLMW